MSEYQAIGKSIPRGDTVAKATGRAVFATDLSRPGMLYGKILHSDQAHARIMHIDASQARALPGVKAVITAADAPRRLFGIYLKDRLIFAADRVRCIGEPVAAVAAVSQAIADAAAGLIRVEYETLPTLFSLEAATLPDAPEIHPGLADYQGIYPYIRYGNVCMDARLTQGDVARGFAEADRIFEDTYHTAATHQAALEPHACLAELDEDERITVWTGTQQLSVTHTELALALDLPITAVRVIPVWSGGGFGGRLKTHLEQICALLARTTRKPVKLVLTRAEEFTTTHGRAPYVIRIRTGVKNDGAITAKEIDVLVDAGGYSDHTIGTATHAITVSQGPYHVPNCQARARVIYTNNPDWGCMRGYGAQEMTFASESHMDGIAHGLGMDPVELRLKNLCREGEPILSTQPLRAVRVRETMEAALRASGYWQKKGQLGPHRGIGVANLFHVTGFLSSSASVRVNEDATVTILTGVTDIGTGTHTVMRQIAAEVLGISVERVRVAALDSDTAPYDTGSISSRTTYDSGNAVRLAAEHVRGQLARVAASSLGCALEEIAIEDGWAAERGRPENRLAFAELVAIALYVTGGPLLGSGSWLAAGPFAQPVGDGYAQGPVGTFLFGTHVAEVEVDVETGKTRVLNFTACHDVGKALNPAGVIGQIEGGLVQGIGCSLYEELQVEQGHIANPSFADYRIPTALDTPPIKALYDESPDPTGPFGAKGIGEPPIMPPAPAIANAIFDATGVRVLEIPITPERLFWALRDNGIV